MKLSRRNIYALASPGEAFAHAAKDRVASDAVVIKVGPKTDTRAMAKVCRGPT